MRTSTRLMLVLAAGLVLAACHQNGTTFVVDTTADTIDVNAGDGLCADAGGDCSLRAAVMEANALPGVEEIRLSTGATYTLALAGAGEDLAATGDLDVTEGVVITGDATIDADGIDRVFHIDIASGLAEIDGPDITGGSADSGAAVLVEGGSLALMNGNVFGNTVVGAVFTTGAPLEYWATAPSYLWSSTVHSNASDGASGAVLVRQGNVDIQNVTITGNDATLAGSAGAIGVVSGQTEIRFSTIIDNTSGHGEIGQLLSTVSIRGSIIGDCGTVTNTDIDSLGGNVVETTTCSFSEPGDQQGVDPLLDPPADNGGTVLTMLPQAASPAIDNAGGLPCTILGLDARGVARPEGAACDSGAVETQP